ncbi:WSC domain-containing protein [Rhizophagus clarus]|uniref:WSC domain-containing protein n=1 Tax=Rhizophagus clarus TaxID=94130 RepID=A0A8H3QND9_9GLOM|nr:WSC domain-containing protein [Rhizophagus clarus]
MVKWFYFNGLETLNSPNSSGLIFPDPYITQQFRIVAYCIKICIDFKFNYAALENGVNCRCGYVNALQSYIEVDDKTCNLSCTTITGKATYPCGGNGAYTVYKAQIQYYTPLYNITIAEKLDIMYNIDKDKDKYPNYRGCIQDDRFCGKRVLGYRCLSTESDS